MCWWNHKYAPLDQVLEGLEKEAREAKRGLWVDPNPCRRGSGDIGEGERESRSPIMIATAIPADF